MRLRVFIAVVCMLAFEEFAAARVTDDRLYLMGDDIAENATVGERAGSGALNFQFGRTLDSVGENGAGNYQDLDVFGNPTYVSAASNPYAPDGEVAMRFSGNDSLRGSRLGFPATSAAAVTGSPPTDYSGISNRGFQMWVKPEASGAGTTQSILADTVQHGVGTSSSNTWTMTYRGEVVDTRVPVVFDQWLHVMVVRPFSGIGDQSGSRLYLNGEIIGMRTGEYSHSDQSALSIGAGRTASGNPVDYFHGVIDDISMFVMGVSLTSHVNYGSFDLLTDNEFVAAAVSGVNGDITGDAIVDAADIAALVDGWLTTKLVDGQPCGDLSTYRSGDLNLDGITDLRDVVLLDRAMTESDLQATLAANGLITVPEPSAMLMLCSAVLLAARVARHADVRVYVSQAGRRESRRRS